MSELSRMASKKVPLFGEDVCSRLADILHDEWGRIEGSFGALTKLRLKKRHRKDLTSEQYDPALAIAELVLYYAEEAIGESWIRENRKKWTDVATQEIVDGEVDSLMGKLSSKLRSAVGQAMEANRRELQHRIGWMLSEDYWKLAEGEEEEF